MHKIQGKRLEQHRRALGDQVKRNVSVEKWDIKACTSIQTTICVNVWCELLGPNNTAVHHSADSQQTSQQRSFNRKGRYYF